MTGRLGRLDPAEIGVVLLAAGRSTRFASGNKLLAAFRGQPLVVHAARTLAALQPDSLIAVCDDEQTEIAELLESIGFEALANPEPWRGLSSSLGIGVGRVRRSSARAVLVCLGDMPDVELAHLKQLIARFDERSAPLVASSREGIASPPALFARALFPRLLELNGDQGARVMLSDAVLVEANGATLKDIDRVADLSEP